MIHLDRKCSPAGTLAVAATYSDDFTDVDGTLLTAHEPSGSANAFTWSDYGDTHHDTITSNNITGLATLASWNLASPEFLMSEECSFTIHGTHLTIGTLGPFIPASLQLMLTTENVTAGNVLLGELTAFNGTRSFQHQIPSGSIIDFSGVAFVAGEAFSLKVTRTIDNVAHFYYNDLLVYEGASALLGSLGKFQFKCQANFPNPGGNAVFRINSVEFSGTPSVSDNTGWTLPYAVATDGSEGTVVVIRNDTGEILTTSRPSPTTVMFAGADLTAVSVTIGISYEFRYTFSTIYPRKQDGRTDTRGRLQLSRAILHYQRSRAFDTEVTPEGRPTRTKSFSAGAVENGGFNFPIQTHNTSADIEVVNDTPHPSILTGLDWEGNLVNRSRRI